mmetsp:Transcript_16886/g.38621  ORF Transcript_16886/g.38621 Transcript_16886/m.38621 type:complete len:267 (+) Transcript_16886:2715-3515(+)
MHALAVDPAPMTSSGKCSTWKFGESMCARSMSRGREKALVMLKELLCREPRNEEKRVSPEQRSVPKSTRAVYDTCRWLCASSNVRTKMEPEKSPSASARKTRAATVRRTPRRTSVSPGKRTDSAASEFERSIALMVMSVLPVLTSTSACSTVIPGAVSVPKSMLLLLACCSGGSTTNISKGMIIVSASVFTCTYPRYLPGLFDEKATLIMAFDVCGGTCQRSFIASAAASDEPRSGIVRCRKFSEVYTSLTCSMASSGLKMEMGGE